MLTCTRLHQKSLKAQALNLQFQNSRGPRQPFVFCCLNTQFPLYDILAHYVIRGLQLDIFGGNVPLLFEIESSCLFCLFLELEVLIEKGSAAVSCEANRTKTVCRTVEHMNSFLLKSIA